MDLLLFLGLFIHFSSADFTLENSKYVFNRGRGLVKSNGNQMTYYNNTYYEKPENMMRVPVSNYNEELQTKKRFLKKSPKRTIQKIIKKNRKNKKVFFSQITSKPTQASEHIDLIDDGFVPDEVDPREESQATTQVSQKKKGRRWNSKMPRNPMPFHRLQQRHDGNYKRARRETDRDNTMIIQDFDEAEFVGHKKDYDVVKLHSKKYW
ncbi:uncharacterized protein [Choristoneura fumiferana]|uniref:uncharacterized protein n=1 Tax=Choristoneura fumiferana TaxID=7141 RepID=UPI003D15980A